MIEHGINIPTSRQPDFQRKKVVRLEKDEHYFFHKAFYDIYVPAKINNRNEYKWVLVDVEVNSKRREHKHN